MPRREATFATVEDMRVISDWLDERDRPEIAAYVRLSFMLGTRPSELLAVTWRDYDADNRALSITKTVTEAGGFQVQNGTKTEKSASTVDLPNPALTDLALLRLRHLAEKDRRGLSWNMVGWIWPGRDGALPLRPSTVSGLFRKAARGTGQDHLTLYSLRHGAGTYLLEQGASIKEIQEHLRHSTARLTTDTYLHVSDRMRERKRSRFYKLR